MLEASFKLITDIGKLMEQEQQRMQKAASLALSIEAYHLKHQGSFLLKTGQLGLVPRSVYRNDPKDKKFKKRDKYNPLVGLYRGFLYKVDKANMSAKIGFLATSLGSEWQAKIAEKSAPGYTWLHTPREIEVLHRAGIHLRKGTTSSMVPGRDILSAVVDHTGGRNAILDRVKRNFEAQMRGEKSSAI